MNRTLTVGLETFTILRRDKIFLPAMVVGLLTLGLAHLASLWGIEEYHKILYDIGTMGFHLTGAVVAILWGTKVVADSRQQGSLELQLASPIGRTTWILGKFLGLFLALLTFGAILIAFWQGLLMMHDMQAFEYKSVMIMLVLMLGWFTLAAVAVFLAAIMGQALALFTCLSFWLAGMVSRPIANVLAPDTPESARLAVNMIARIWDIGRFNLGGYAFTKNFPSTSDLVWIGAYGFFLVGTLLTLGCIFFSQKDLID